MKRAAVAEAALQSLQHDVATLLQARQFLLDQPADDEALHQFRVAIRRLRSGLRPIQRWLVGEGAKQALQALKQVAEASNPLRDHEVQAKLVHDLLLPAWQPAHADWFALKAAQQASARQALLLTLAQPALALQIGTLGEAAGAALLAHARQIKPAVRQQRKQLRQRVLRVARRPSWALKHTDRWHALRLDCKRLRYLLEGHQAGAGKRWEAERTAAKQAQDVLGRLHDLALFREQLAQSDLPLLALVPLLWRLEHAWEGEARDGIKALRQALTA